MEEVSTLRDRRQEAVNEHFRAAAPYWRDVYDDQQDVGLVYRHRQEFAAGLIDGLVLPVGAHALEIGSGAGNMAVLLARRGLVVDAVDVAPSMVAMTVRQARAAGMEDRVSATIADIHALPFPDGAFDLVVALGVFPWLSAPSRAASELARVLRPSGSAVVTADNKWRLAELLDPLTSPAFAGLRRAVKRFLERTGRRRAAGAPLARRTSLSEFADFFASAGLSTIGTWTTGFSRPTFFGRPLLPARLSEPLHSTLQYAADERFPIVHAMGSQVVLLLQKPAGTEMPRGD
jgi:ubiquinone/menaquinone biosynthesis C-methylase UbiE